MSWILTKEGIDFDLTDPRPQDVRLKDIVYALSNICRFSGHCSRHYSVLEHSLIGAKAILRSKGSKQLAREFLLHDAHEAYMGDISSPIKWACPQIKLFESGIDRAVRLHFEMLPEMPQSAKHMGLIMLAAEKLCLLPASGDPWPILMGVPADDKIVEEIQSCKYAIKSRCRDAFLALFEFVSR